MNTKYILVLILLLNSLLFSQQSGWVFVNPQPTNMTLNKIKFLNQNTAIAIGYYGTVFKTTDSGKNWSNPISTKALTGLEKLHYFDLEFFDQNTGVIIGDNAGGFSKLFKTTNAGTTWQDIAKFTGLARAMCFINIHTGWVANGVNVYKTTTGGTVWQASVTTFPSGIICMLFLDQSTGFAAASNKIFKTTDGGINWFLANTFSGGDINDMYFLNSMTGFAAGAGSNSVVYKTTDGGVTWITKLSGNLTGTLSAIYFINDLTGFTAGGGYDNPPPALFKTSNAGETWIQISISATYHINSIGLSGNYGITVGYNGQIGISTDQGLNWSFTSNFLQQNLGFFPMSFINEYTGWLSTTGSTADVPIYRSTNGGINWLMLCMISPYPDWIQFLNENTGYYKSYNTLYKSTNSGYNWIQATPLNINVSSINFSDANTGYACGYTTPPIRPKLIKTINGGSTWDTIHVSDDYTSVSTFHFVNENTGWVSLAYAVYPMGTNSKIYKTTNRGVNWIYQRTDSNASHRKISFIDNLTGWAALNDFYKLYGNVIKTTNGGNTWFHLPINVLWGMFQFVNTNTGWAEDGNGSLYKTTNGGLNWYAQSDIGLAGIENMQFINPNTGWIVGDGGLIVKTTNGGELVGLYNTSTEMPQKFSLLQNYPNPFNPITAIKFDLPKSGFVEITIYDINGREIAKLVQQQMQAGSYSADWDASNYSSGVYICRLSTEGFTSYIKMVLIK